jgi:alpha-tubulin suppressor-like RCC1 family protein
MNRAQRMSFIACFAMAVAAAGACGSDPPATSEPVDAGTDAVIDSSWPTSDADGGGAQLPKFQALVAGGEHTCGIAEDGTTLCWGSNRYGELGAAEPGASTVPVPVSGISATELALGDAHTCALAADGSVKCWGSNHFGQIGSGQSPLQPRVTSPTPVASSEPAVALTAGAVNTCAVLASGSAECAGDNEYSQIADEVVFDQSAPLPLSHVGTVSALSLGAFHACAKLEDSTPLCWGYHNTNATGHGGFGVGAPIGVGVIEQIVSGGNISCALDAAKDVLCWGSFYLDDVVVTSGTGVKKLEGLAAPAAVAVGLSHACALEASGSVQCWGYNRYGQLGRGNTESTLTPSPVTGLSDATAISAGYLHTCALRKDQTAVCWGKNRWGQLGDGTTDQSSIPVPVVAPGSAGAVPLAAIQTAERKPDGKLPGVGYELPAGATSRFACPGGKGLCDHMIDTRSELVAMPGITPSTWAESAPETFVARFKRWGTRNRTAQGQWAELFWINETSLENAFVAGLLGSADVWDGQATMVEQFDSAYTIPRHSAWHCEHWMSHNQGGSPEDPLPISDPNKPAGAFSEKCPVWSLCTCYYVNTP